MLLVFLLVLAVGAVGADRAAAVVAEHRIARQVATKYGLDHRPAVHIGGFPLITQAIRGHYGRVSVDIGDWSGADGGKTATVHDLVVTLTGVSADARRLLRDDTAGVAADAANATAVVPFDTVRGYAPSGVESLSDAASGMAVSGTLPVSGVRVPATVVVTLALGGGGIVVTPITVRAGAGGGIGPTLPVGALKQYLAFTVPLPALPLGLEVTAVSVTPAGVAVTATARDVELATAYLSTSTFSTYTQLSTYCTVSLLHRP
jgi:hypothetical protein